MTELHVILGIIGVILLDGVLSGDNAVVIAMTANRLPRALRDRAILLGMTAAVLLRILLCVFAGALLANPYFGPIAGLCGGNYLLWVAWALYQGEEPAGVDDTTRAMTWTAAMAQIILADFSMSIDNIVAVAGLMGGHPVVMALGVGLSVLLLAVGAKVLSGLMERYRWLNIFGAAMIAAVGGKMILDFIAWL